MALTGAVVYLLARIAYLPAYISGVTGLSSILWGFGPAGLIAMLVHLLP